MKLQELQNRREELAREIHQLADREKEWTAEDKQKWVEVNEAYNTNYAEFVAEKKREEEAMEQADSVQNRLKEINGHNSNGITPRIGRDGAGLGSPQDREAKAGLALTAFINGSGHHDVDPRAMQACHDLGIDPRQKSITLNLMPTAPARKIQNIFRRTSERGREHAIEDLCESPRFRNDLSVVTGATGGALITEGLMIGLERNMLAFGGMLQVSEILRTERGDRIPWATVDDTSNSGEQIGESTSIGSSTDPAFAALYWDAYKFHSKPILVPTELFEDSPFNIPSLIGDLLGERLGRISNTKFTTGTGAGTPRGITIAATLGVTAASATAITWEELYDLEHSVDPAYRNGAGYMCHDNVVLYLRKLVDGEGRPIWQSGANTGTPDTLNARPFTINQDMASSVATTNITLLFGQLNKYKVRQVRTVRLVRLDERYADTDQVAFDAFIRQDGNLLDAGTAPVKYLQQA